MAINFDVHDYNEQPEQENLQQETPPMGDDTWLQDQFTNKAYDNEETRNAAWAERGLDPNAYEWITDEQGNLYTEGNPAQTQVPEEPADVPMSPEPEIPMDEGDLLTDTDEDGSEDIIGAVDENDLSPDTSDETITSEAVPQGTETEPEPEIAPEIPADSVDNTNSSISEDELAQIESEGNTLEGDDWTEWVADNVERNKPDGSIRTEKVEDKKEYPEYNSLDDIKKVVFDSSKLTGDARKFLDEHNAWKDPRFLDIIDDKQDLWDNAPEHANTDKHVLGGSLSRVQNAKAHKRLQGYNVRDYVPHLKQIEKDVDDGSSSMKIYQEYADMIKRDEYNDAYKGQDLKPFGGFSWESNPETRDAVVNTIAESLGVEATDEIKKDISAEPEFTEKVMDAYGIDYHDDLIKSYEKKVKEAHDKVLNFKLAYTGKKEDMLKSRELKKLEEEESKAQKWLDMLRQDQKDDFNGMGWNNGKVDVYDKDAPDYVPSEERPDLGEGSREVLVKELEKEIEQEPDEEKKSRKERILRWVGSGVSLSTPKASLNENLGETSSVRGGNIGNTPSGSVNTSRGSGSASKAFHDIMSAPLASKGQGKMTYENIGQSLSGIHSGSVPRIPDSGKPTSAKASGPTTRMFNDIIKGNTAKPMAYDKTPKGNYSIKGIPTSKKSGGQGESGGKLGLPKTNAAPRISMIIDKIIAKVRATPDHKIEKGRLLIEMEDGKAIIKFGSYRKTSLENFAKQHPKELEQVYQLIK